MADETRFAALCDLSIPADERRRLLDELLQEDEGCITLARCNGLLHGDWPPGDAARTLGGNDLFLLAVCMPENAVAGILANAEQEDVERLVLAVRLASAVPRFDPAAAERFEPLLRTLLGDRRRAFPQLEHACDSLGAYAQEHHRIVMTALCQGDANRHGHLIQAAIAASLERGSEESALYGVFEDGLRIGLPPACLAQCLNSVLADAAASPAARLAARRALDVLAGLARHPDGAPAGMEAAMNVAYEDAATHLESILRDARSPEPLRSEVEAKLYRWAPLTYLRLQQEGLLPTLPIPSRRQHKNWSPAGVEALARQVSWDEAAALLADPKAEAVDRIVTALRIAPAFSAWLPGALERFAPLFVALLPSRIPVPMKSGVRTLGDMALEKFPELFPPVDSQTAAMQETLCAGLEAARAAGLDLERVEDWLPNLLSPRSMKKLGIHT